MPRGRKRCMKRAVRYSFTPIRRRAKTRSNSTDITKAVAVASAAPMACAYGMSKAFKRMFAATAAECLPQIIDGVRRRRMRPEMQVDKQHVGDDWDQDDRRVDRDLTARSRRGRVQIRLHFLLLACGRGAAFVVSFRRRADRPTEHGGRHSAADAAGPQAVHETCGPLQLHADQTPRQNSEQQHRHHEGGRRRERRTDGLRVRYEQGVQEDVRGDGG